MEFKIGDRVRVRPYDEIPEDIRNKGLGKHAGKEGEIVDVMRSGARDCNVYRIHFDGVDRPSVTDFIESTFDLVVEDQVTYSYEFDFAENLVSARFYETKGDHRKMIARGHGHIFHDGALGIAQASSYALKRIYQHLEEGQNEQKSY